MTCASPNDEVSSRSTAEQLSEPDWLLNAAPGVREAIRQRLEEYPEYRTWLEQFGSGLLRAVE